MVAVSISDFGVELQFCVVYVCLCFFDVYVWCWLLTDLGLVLFVIEQVQRFVFGCV